MRNLVNGNWKWSDEGNENMSVRLARVKYPRVYQEPPAISDSGIQHPAFPSNDPILRICIRYSIVNVGISKLLFYLSQIDAK